jgi:putative membrane protein
MWYMHDGMGWWMVPGGIWMVVFWSGIIALVVWGISKLTGRGNSSGRQTPLEIAKERYARGEISRKELEQMKKDL